MSNSPQQSATTFDSSPRPSARSSWRIALAGAMALAQLAFVPAITARAQAPVTITQWTFEGDVATPSTGAGAATLTGGTTATFATGFPASPSRGWNTSGYPVQGTNSRTAGAQFAVSTVGFSDISFSFDQRHSNTAANTVALLYSTDGVNFAEAQVFTANAGDAWFARAVNLSSIPALNNNPNVIFRVVSSFVAGGSVYVASNPSSAYGASGTLRFDNVTITGIPGGPPPGDTPPSVASIVPANGATGVAVASDLVITFSEPVNVSGNWFSIACTLSGARGIADVAVTGGPVAFTLNPNTDFAANESCTLTVFAAQVTDQDVNDPPDAMATDFVSSFALAAPAPPACTLPSTPIYTVQGIGETSPLSGTIATVQGAVVGDFQGPTPALRGFYFQDPVGDGDPATSDGVFVFNGNNISVTVGQVVRVTGLVQEFQGQTQIGNLTALEQCGTTASLAPTDVTLPFPTLDFPERFEGMLVRLPQALYVSEHFQLGRFGQVVMSSGDRLRIPTQLAAPGAPAQAIQATNDLNRIIVDDRLNNQNPDPIVFGGGTMPLAANNTLRVGDTATGITGLMTFGWAGNAASPNAYRVRPTVQPSFVATNPRPAKPNDVGGTLKAASTNVLNYFNTFTGCTFGVGGAPADCRGAENQIEFDRQAAKVVANLVGTGADILAMSELENDGYGPTSAIADLVNRMNAATAPGTYAYIDADARTGQVNALGVDAIKVGLIYKPAKVTPVGTTAALNTGAFGLFQLADGTQQQRSRPPLAQTFEQLLTGERITVLANHLKSKGSPCADNVSPVGPDPDLGDGAGNCNLTRKAAAQDMVTWLATSPTGINTPNVLILGDLNSYAKEDPITAIVNAGYTNLVESRLGPNAYSYVFGAQSGYLDHALASPALVSRISGITEWHTNADEPPVLDFNTNFKSAGQIVSLFAPDAFRSSDHDPLIVGLNLNTPPAITALETYDTGLGDRGAEIISARGNRAVLTNAGDGSVDVLDISDPLDIKLIRRIGGLTGLNSVAIHPSKDFFITVAGVSSPAAAPVNGTATIFRLSDGALLGTAPTGIQPDSISISPDGNFAVVANEAEAFAQGDNGGPGSITVIPLSAFDPTAPTALTPVQIALPSQNGVTGFSVNRTDDIGRLPVDNTPSTLEPESVAFSPDSAFAYVTLQENSGAARVTLVDTSYSLTFFGLGQTAHLADLTVDGVYRPVETLTAFREPDGIAVIEIGGARYLVTADEGDTRNGDGSSGPRGGRTVSVFNVDTGAFVADTSGQLDDFAAARGVYPDPRSNRGGSEPEVLDATVFNGRAIVAVGLERANAVALVDVSVPTAPRVFQLINTGVGPEGIKLFEKDGALFFFAANEVSGTLSVARVPEGDAIFSQTYTEDQPLALNDVAVIDPDTADTISVMIQSSHPASGTLSAGVFGSATATYNAAAGLYQVAGSITDVNAALASIVFTPAADENGTLRLTVNVSDGLVAAQGVLTLIGVPVNDPPAPTPDTLTTYQYLAVTVTTGALTANDVDVDGGALVVLTVSAASANAGVVTLDADVVKYTPPGSFIGTDTFTYTVDDGADGSAEGTVTVNVLPLPPAVSLVRPVFECVSRVAQDRFVAYFGYRNDNPYPVVIPIGQRNRFVPAPQDRGQTTVFLPGRKAFTFAVEFRVPALIWLLDGRAATASWFSKRCS